MSWLDSLRLNKESWAFIGLTIASAIVLFNCVNLVPHVDNNFFFSNTDLQFQDENLISHSFKRKDNLLIINASGPIKSSRYMQRIKNLSDSLLSLKHINGLKSISHGPISLQNAFESPLWERLLIAKNDGSTNIIIFLQDDFPDTVIPKIERLVTQSSSPDFHLTMSGSPYIVWHIGRFLLKDIRIFSLLILVIFGIVIFFIFRSKEILIGSIISCINGSMWTLLITHILGIKIGLLTANIATIVFVLTLSHIVFLTYNWKYVCTQSNHTAPVQEAIHLTFSPSFWSMMTTLFGFLSLLLVPAQPLKELGASGVIGALVAITVAYSVYPAFLRLVRPSFLKDDRLDCYQKIAGKFLENKKKETAIGLLILFVLTLPGLWMANTDPSLISYFKKNSPIEQGLTYIDQNGGSSPLILVIKTTSGEKIDTNHAYQELWNLQKDLESNPAVGTIISLPVIIAQAPHTNFLSILLSHEELLNTLEQPQYEEIAKSFITEDHMEGLFLLRMNESKRNISRLKIIDEIKKTVYADGFIPKHIGGIYSLQGHLAQLVTSSVIFGIGQLIIIFSLIAWIVSRSLRITLAITLSICIIPVIVLGTIGWLHIPLDVISAPACNIALGLGIDSMIHMVRAFRRQKNQNKNDVDTWKHIRHRFWQPILTFTSIMVFGFGIFMFSEFPSTQRFGASVVFGALIASMTALFIMPAIAQIKNSSPHLAQRQ